MLRIFKHKKPIIGVVHLDPLPGSPRNEKSIEEIARHAVHDARIYANAGMDGIIVENFGDNPFYPERVGPETVAAMTYIASEVIKKVKIPIGIQVLRNDAKAALAIAKTVGAKFIRVNILGEAMVTDTGIIQSRAYDLLRYRKFIGAEDVKIFADIRVKHAVPIAERDMVYSAEDLVFRCMADALIIMGPLTGESAELNNPKMKSKRLKGVPVFVGGGVNKDNVAEYYKIFDGIIIASSLKVDGIPTNPLNPKRVSEFMRKVEELRQNERLRFK